MNEKDESWAELYNFDPHLLQAGPTADRCIGVFGRLGLSDGDPNSLQFLLSTGVGGKGPRTILTLGRQIVRAVQKERISSREDVATNTSFRVRAEFIF